MTKSQTQKISKEDLELGKMVAQRIWENHSKKQTEEEKVELEKKIDEYLDLPVKKQ